jgi:tetratricopeptide (TPR) repeat protein
MNINEIAFKLSEEGKIFDIAMIFPKEELFTFLAGAGISMDPPSNVPSARMFVKKLFQYYAPEDEIEILLNLESLRYEFLVEKVQNFFDKELSFLDYLDHISEPNAIHIFLANMIMRYNYVITTNFDYLIETALKNKLAAFPLFHDYHKKKKIIIIKDDYQQDVSFQFPLIKIHGSKKNIFTGRITSESLVTTITALGREREKGKTFAIEPYKKKLVDELMRSRNLVIMGYSGSDDFDIGPLLEELKTMTKVIWIDHNQEGINHQEEIYKYKQIQDSNILKSASELSKLDYLLARIASSGNFEVYKIRAKTLDFISTRLASVLEVYLDTPKIDETVVTQSFDDYMSENHFKISHSSKYKLAHEIFYDLGEFRSAERTAMKGLTLAQGENNELNQLYFTNSIGLIQNSKGDYDGALENFEKSYSLSKRLNKTAEKLGVLINIGDAYKNKNDIKNAIKYTTEALGLTNDTTPAIIKFSVLNSLGVIYRKIGDLPNATKSFEDALAIVEMSGDLFRKSLCYNNLAGIKQSQGLLQPASNYASEALKIDEQLGDIEHMCSTLNTIGNIYIKAGRFEIALQHLERAYTIAGKIESSQDKARILNSIGLIFYQKGHNDLALKKYEEALKISEEIADMSGKATAFNNIGMLYRNRGEINKAFDFICQSIETSEKIHEKTHLAVRYGNRGSIFEVKGELEKALEDYNKALMIEKSQNNLEGIARQLTNIGGIYGDLGKYGDTLKNYKDALTIMEQLGNKPGIANVLNNLGVIYFKYQKNYREAMAHLERALIIYKELKMNQEITSTERTLLFIKNKYDSTIAL